jgi:hypothetical protein
VSISGQGSDIVTATIVSGGSGYAANDRIMVTGGTGGVIKILTVNGSGAALTISVLSGGSGYTVATHSTVNLMVPRPGGGQGTGCTIAVATTGNIVQLTTYSGINSTSAAKYADRNWVSPIIVEGTNFTSAADSLFQFSIVEGFYQANEDPNNCAAISEIVQAAFVYGHPTTFNGYSVTLPCQRVTTKYIGSNTFSWQAEFFNLYRPPGVATQIVYFHPGVVSEARWLAFDSGLCPTGDPLVGTGAVWDASVIDRDPNTTWGVVGEPLRVQCPVVRVSWRAYNATTSPFENWGDLIGQVNDSNWVVAGQTSCSGTVKYMGPANVEYINNDPYGNNGWYYDQEWEVKPYGHFTESTLHECKDDTRASVLAKFATLDAIRQWAPPQSGTFPVPYE